MIDYNKLKQAHTLAEKISKNTGRRVDIVLSFFDDEGVPGYSLVDFSIDHDFDMRFNIDHLLLQLKELAETAPIVTQGAFFK